MCSLLGERRFSLNKSKSKFVVIGLSGDDFEPCIQISGTKGDEVAFNESEWKLFLDQQGIISNYFYSNDAFDELNTDSFRLEFKVFTFSKAMQIIKNGSSVYLACETVSALWNFLPLIEYRCDILKKQQFRSYFHIIQKAFQSTQDPVSSVFKFLEPEENKNSENVSMVMEFLLSEPEKFKAKFGKK